MTFPLVVDADTQANVVTSNSNSWTLSYPTNLQNGDLILFFIGCDGGSVSGGATGFVTNNVSEGSTSLIAGKRKSNGTESGTFTVSLSGSEQGCWRVIRITGWEGTLGTFFYNADSGTGSVVWVGSTTLDPPNCDPVNWATEDTLWIAASAADHGNTTYTGFPGSYGNTSAQNSGGAGGAALGTARRTNAVSAEDPSAFTISASEGAASATIAVRPSAGGAQQYDETGRQVTVAATVTRTEQADLKELARQATIAATISRTDIRRLHETGRQVTVAATLDRTDALTRGELNRQVVAAATVDRTDTLTLGELGRQVVVAATIDRTDIYTPAGGQQYDETGRQVVVAATLDRTDQADFAETAEVVITATLDRTDLLTLGESGRELTVAATVTVTDSLTWTEALTVTVGGTLDESDIYTPAGGQQYNETGRELTVAATVTASDGLPVLLYPDADIAATGWETAPTPGQSLYAQLDEVGADVDADYIYASA